MSETTRVKDRIKQEILSLLVSAPKGLSVKELEKDYKRLVGAKSFPYRELGYSSTLDFLASIKDCVSLSYENGQNILRPVCNEKTVKIQKMVQVQKRNARKTSSKYDYYKPFVSHFKKPPNRPYVSAYIRSQVNELLTKYDGLDSQDFCKYYKKLFGHDCAYRDWGFNTLNEFFQSLSGIVYLEILPGGGYKIFQSQSLHNRTRNVTSTDRDLTDGNKQFLFKKNIDSYRSNINRSDINASFHKPSEFVHNYESKSDNGNKFLKKSSESVQNTNKRMPLVLDDSFYQDSNSKKSTPPLLDDSYYQNSKKTTPPLFNDKFFQHLNTFNETSHNDKPFKSFHTNKSNVSLTSISTQTNEASYLNLHDTFSNQSNNYCESSNDLLSKEKNGPIDKQLSPTFSNGMCISGQLKSEIRQILEENPLGIKASTLQDKYKTLFNKDLDLKECGIFSIVSLASYIPDIVTLKRQTTVSDWILYDSRLQIHIDPECQLLKEPQRSEQLLAIKKNILYLLNVNPFGIILSEIPKVYQQQIGEILIYENLGFENLESLFLEFADVLKMHYMENGSIQVLLLNQSEIDFVQKGSVETLHNSKHKDKKNRIPNFIHKMPSDVVGYSNSYKMQTIPDGEYVEVYVSNIINPDKIWIQLRGECTSVQLEILMDALEEEYSDISSRSYIMNETMIKIGQVCCALFEDENWHRAVITGIRDEEFVEVQYIDYGTICLVSTKCIRLLKTKFFDLPMQAIQTKLANLKPIKGSEWSADAVNFLLSVCENKAFLAKVVDPASVMSVFLIDTSGEDDVHINDLLISNGYAVSHIENWQNISESFDSNDFVNPLSEMVQYIQKNSTSEMKITNLVDDTENIVDHMSREFEEELSIEKRYIKKIILSDDIFFHVINHHDKLYLSKVEFYSFLVRHDYFLNVIEPYEKLISTLVISEDHCKDLFMKFKKFGLEETNNDYSNNEVVLFELSDVCNILASINPLSELVNVMQDEISNFDPDDLYWTGLDSILESMTADELILASKVLQASRSRILHNMNTQSAFEYVDYIADIETKLFYIGKLLKSHWECQGSSSSEIIYATH